MFLVFISHFQYDWYFTIREHLGSPLIFGEVRVAYLFSFLCRVFCCFCCCVSSSCVPNVVSFFEWSILDSPFGFL